MNHHSSTSDALHAETARLRLLANLAITGQAPDETISALAAAAASLFATPIALVTLVDELRVHLYARSGFESADAPRQDSFCTHALATGQQLIVEDATQDARFAANPYVTGPEGIRFYAGQPLVVHGQEIGTLCILDRKARRFSDSQSEALRGLALAVQSHIEQSYELRQSQTNEARLQDFVLASADFLWECDLGLQITWRSDTGTTSCGAAPLGEVGERIPDAVVLDALGTPHPHHLRLHTLFSLQLSFNDRIVELGNATQFTNWSISAVPIWGQDGRMKGWRGAAEDVTHSIANARRAALMDERLKLTAKNLPGVVYQFELSRQGRAAFAYLSEALVDLCDLEPRAVEDNVDLVFERIHPDDHALIRESILTSARTLRPLDIRYRILHPRRGLRWLEGRATPTALADGTVRWHGFINDVTDQQRTQSTLDETRRRLDMALSVMDLGVIVVDPVDLRVCLDARACAAHGVPASDSPVPLAWWTQTMDPQDAAAIADQLQRLERTEEKTKTHYTLHTASGSRRFEMHMEHHRGIGKIVCVTRDVTEREEAQRALIAAHALIESRKSQVEFLSRVSHELRTPLNAILGFTDLLKQDRLPGLAPKHAFWIDQVQFGGRHLLSLVEDILDLTRVDSGRHDLKHERIPAHDLIADCMKLLQPLAAPSGIEVRLSPLSHDAVLCADGRAMRQVLVNVLANAIKYNVERGQVQLSVSRSAGTCVISVSDDGPGIVPEALARIFTPFERLGAERSPVRGSGLGLAIAKSLTEAMGGTISVSSQVGKGTVVCIAVPAAEATAPAAAPLPPAPALRAPTLAPAPAPRGEPPVQAPLRLRALYVEDEPINALLMGALFARLDDWELTHHENPHEAIADFSRSTPDLVLMDLHMPALSGFDVLARMQALPGAAYVPFVAVSADAQPLQREQCLDAGFSEFWPKPLDISFIQARLAELGHTIRETT